MQNVIYVTSLDPQLLMFNGLVPHCFILFYSILLVLYSVPALKMCCSPNINYVHGVTLELKPKDK